MISIKFTDENINELRNLSQEHPHRHVRAKAFALILKSQNIAHHIIAHVIGICENTLRDYFRSYLRAGIEEITKINFAKPTSALVEYKQTIVEYIDQNPPASIKQACDEIGKLTGIKIRESQMRKYLKSIGVRHRKACGVPAKADIGAQKAFLENELQPRLDKALEGKCTVKFIDAAHFVLGGFFGLLWSFKRVFVQTPSGRQRLNVLGALDAVTKKLTTVTNDSYITAVQVCMLLEKIASETIGPIIVVMDNARYQRCKLVLEKAKELNIELLFLPPYSPNLNLIERVWKFIRKNCLNSKYYSNFNLFQNAISNFIINMHQVYGTDLESLLTLKFQLFSKEFFSRAI